MAYQSIGQLNTAVTPTINYVPRVITPPVPKFNLNSIKDVPTLTAALHSGQINQNQWMQQFKQIQSKQPGEEPLQSTGLGAVPGVLKQKTVTPLKNTLVGWVNQAKAQVSHLSAPTINQQQVNSIMANQKAAATNPEYIKATAGIKPGTNSSAGMIQAEKMAASGAKAPQIKAYLQKDATALNNQTNQGINTVLTLTGFSAPGEGILAKGIGAVADKTGVVAALGKDEATNTLIDSQKAAIATRQASLAEKLGSPAVQEARTQHIPVISPTQTSAARSAVGSTALENADRASIPVTGKSTEVTGKVTSNPDSKYIAASNKLSSQYEKELAQVKNVPHPVTQQVLQRNLDQKYQGLQADLDNKFGKTSVNFKGAAKPVTTQLPSSALDKQPTSPFEPRTSPETVTAPKTVLSTGEAPKETQIASTKPTPESTPNTGPKVSGGALNAESRAVQKGLTDEFPDKATYKSGSYKQEADKAVNLVNTNPEEAMKIATGAKPGDNTIHEVAVAKAVENKALQNGDVDTLTRLAQSPRHTATSEAAQRLGAEGFSAARNSPVQAIREISQAREKAILGKGEQSGEKAVTSTVKDIQKTVVPKLKVSRQAWHSFIQELQCK